MFAKTFGCLVGWPFPKSLEAGSRWAPFLARENSGTHVRRAWKESKTVPLQQRNERRWLTAVESTACCPGHAQAVWMEQHQVSRDEEHGRSLFHNTILDGKIHMNRVNLRSGAAWK